MCLWSPAGISWLGSYIWRGVAASDLLQDGFTRPLAASQSIDLGSSRQPQARAIFIHINTPPLKAVHRLCHAILVTFLHPHPPSPCHVPPHTFYFPPFLSCKMSFFFLLNLIYIWFLLYCCS